MFKVTRLHLQAIEQQRPLDWFYILRRNGTEKIRIKSKRQRVREDLHNKLRRHFTQ